MGIAGVAHLGGRASPRERMTPKSASEWAVRPTGGAPVASLRAFDTSLSRLARSIPPMQTMGAGPRDSAHLSRVGARRAGFGLGVPVFIVCRLGRVWSRCKWRAGPEAVSRPVTLAVSCRVRRAVSCA